MSVAGFNLGEYASASVASEAHSIEVYANRELEENLRKRLSSQDAGDLALRPRLFGSASTGHPVVPPLPSPSPPDALKQLVKEINSSIPFYTPFIRPFPFPNLT